MGADGSVYPFGDARDFGSVTGAGGSTAIVGIVPTADGAGYWEVGRDGAVYPFGDAFSHGDVLADGLATTIVGLVPTSTGTGYWEVGADGAIYPYGDAEGMGSALQHGLSAHIVAGIVFAPSPTAVYVSRFRIQRSGGRVMVHWRLIDVAGESWGLTSTLEATGSTDDS